jgi:hypothetical protein
VNFQATHVYIRFQSHRYRYHFKQDEQDKQNSWEWSSFPIAFASSGSLSGCCLPQRAKEDKWTAEHKNKGLVNIDGGGGMFEIGAQCSCGDDCFYVQTHTIHNWSSSCYCVHVTRMYATWMFKTGLSWAVWSWEGVGESLFEGLMAAFAWAVVHVRLR